MKRRTVIGGFGTLLFGGVAGLISTGSPGFSDPPQGIGSVGRCQIPRYYYERVEEEGEIYYERRSPINVVSYGYEKSQIKDIVQADDDWITNICEYPRYVYNYREGYVMGPGVNLNDNYISFGTAIGCNGSGEREHVKGYEIDAELIVYQAHHDGEVHGSQISYESAQEATVSLIQEHSDPHEINEVDWENGNGKHDGIVKEIIAYEGAKQECGLT